MIIPHVRTAASPPVRALLPVALATALALSACATNDPNRRTKIGAGIGAVAGGVIGNQVGGRTSRLVGAVAGALAGGAVGRYQDRQQQALEAALEEERRANEVDVERLEDDVLLVRMSDQATFDVGSSALKSAFLPTLDKIAGQMSSFDKTVLHIVGHTDSSGSDAYNQALSERRADAVADYLRGDGVLSERLQTEGRGERSPRASNATAADRALNRRVEIYIKPIVEGREEEALTAPS